MYVPPQFNIADRAWARELIARYPFGLLVTGDAEYPRVSHLPLVARDRDGALWIYGHVARANPHAASIRNESPATLVFEGAHAYVSASWYEEPYETVSTWNYSAVHVCGRLREYDAWEAVKLLTEQIEGNAAGAWDPQRLAASYRDNQLAAIVAFELRAEALYAKAKLSQNRTDADRLRVIDRLASSPEQGDRETARAMADIER